MEKKTVETIYCIGDSHSNIFSGHNKMQPIWPTLHTDLLFGLKSFRVGPALAYNLVKRNSTVGGREKVLNILGTIPSKSKVLLCFGEIDCRKHIVKQAKHQNISIDLVAKQVAQNYLQFAKEVVQSGYTVCILAVTPTTKYAIGQNSMTCGAYVERLEATSSLNKYLKIYCKESDIYFANPHSNFFHSNSMPRMKYFADSIHLSQFALPPILRALNISGFLTQNHMNSIKLNYFKTAVHFVSPRRLIELGHLELLFLIDGMSRLFKQN